MKDKKGIAILNVFQSILGNSKWKPNKIWADEGSEFYNKSFKKWLKHKRKSVVSERFTRTLKNKIYKHMSANVYFDVLNDIFDEYNNTYHKTIKMKPIDVKNDPFSKYNDW